MKMYENFVKKQGLRNKGMFVLKLFVFGMLSSYLFSASAENESPSVEKQNLTVEKPDLMQTKQQINRNGFFDLKLNSTIKFDEALSLSSNYGFVLEKELWLFPSHIFESQINIGFRIPMKNSIASHYYSIAVRQEYNLLPNDGMNKYIPGFSLSFGLNIGESVVNIIAVMDLGAYYKIFISDHFAFIPEIHFSREFLGKNSWELSLGLRRYF